MSLKHDSGHSNPIITAPLPDLIAQNIEMVAALHAQQDREISGQQRFVEQIAEFFGRPIFLYCALVGIAIWMLGGFINRADILPFHLPTFQWLDQGLDTASFLISTGVLIRQTRQENFAEQRTQLMLQLNLVSEQKIAKIIALLEELRADSPDVHNRYDAEAQVMQNAADPIEVLETLQESLNRELSSATKPATNNKSFGTPRL
jgi:uncharacterized membrane protein